MGGLVFSCLLFYMEKSGSCTSKPGSLLCDDKIRPMIFERGAFSFICLNHLQDLAAIATPAIELSFPEQTNYPPKQCLCVSNRTGTNTSLLFPCLCMICVEDDSAEQGMAFIC